MAQFIINRVEWWELLFYSVKNPKPFRISKKGTPINIIKKANEIPRRINNVIDIVISHNNDGQNLSDREINNIDNNNRIYNY